jgi:BirA family biotin operon repressor/biotin-[acetyl-CoA-carboxylase] ligase
LKATEIYIAETPSTNTLVKSYLQDRKLNDFSLVYTDHQTRGRGQMGSDWSSEKAKNIACSLYKEFNGVRIDEQFIISMIVSLSIAEALEELMVLNIRIKWPNDIYALNKKIAGVLIETTMSGTEISSAIIGVGINVNQQDFTQLPNATSLISILGKPTDRSYLLHLYLEKFVKWYEKIDKGYDFIKTAYEAKLYRKDKVSLFNAKDIGRVNGIIKGVNQKGQLLVDIDTKGLMTFNLKELQLLSSN